MTASIPFPLATGLEFALRQASTSGWLITAIIAILSVTVWFIIALKVHTLTLARSANAEFLQVFRHTSHPLAIFQSGDSFPDSPLFHIYIRAAEDLSFHLLGVIQPDKTFSQRLQGAGLLTASQANAVRRTMERAMNEGCIKLESRVSALALIVSAAPLLGLLGTVWGIMASFAEISGSAGAVPIQAVAPGVAGALLTTVMGLMVVLPSMAGYNFLISRIRAMTMRLENFAGELGTLLDRHYVDHRSMNDELPSLGAMGPPTASGYSTPSATSLPKTPTGNDLESV
jgi:biopolymer transport protein ExbB/TolQ